MPVSVFTCLQGSREQEAALEAAQLRRDVQELQQRLAAQAAALDQERQVRPGAAGGW